MTMTERQKPSAPPPPATMRAAVQHRYGLDEIEIDDVPVPTPGPTDLLVRVEAASINPADWHKATGEPAFLRLTDGFARPAQTIIGTDAVGVVVDVGADVTGVAPGARVFGAMRGAFAEFALIDVERAALAPTTIPATEIAGLPIAGVTALQAVQRADVEGRRIAINGASGGVGHYAVQIARAYGAASITAVCSTRNADMVRFLGADRAVDYATDDFTTDAEYDVVIDLAGNRSATDVARCLTPTGRWLLLGPGKKTGLVGPIPSFLAAMAVFARSKRSLVVFTADETAERLDELARLYDEGRIQTLIDTEYPLHRIDDAFVHLATKRARGKIILTV